MSGSEAPLSRAPTLTLKALFAEAYRSGRFTQLELISDRDLISEARKPDLSIRQDTLEELDRYGAFTPVAFVGADWHGYFYGPRWNLSAMTFRKEFPPARIESALKSWRWAVQPVYACLVTM